MKARVRREGDLVVFDCPACKGEQIEWGDGEVHPLIPYHEVNVGVGGWEFNGSMERPTLKPSVRVRYGEHLDYVCHFFVQDGRIVYCGDSTHRLSGKTVELEELEELGA